MHLFSSVNINYEIFNSKRFNDLFNKYKYKLNANKTTLLM